MSKKDYFSIKSTIEFKFESSRIRDHHRGTTYRKVALTRRVSTLNVALIISGVLLLTSVQSVSGQIRADTGQLVAAAGPGPPEG